ncbi:YhdP family protein [Afipia felis]
MPDLKPQKASRSQADDWDDAPEWEEDRCHQARRLLKRRSRVGLHRLTEPLARFGHRVLDTAWLRRTLTGFGVLAAVFAIGFFGLWLRLGAGPINLDIVTPWLASAIEQNLGREHTVEVGGTQIERAGRIRVAVRLRDIVVRDHNKAVVASAPKAEVRLSGMALLFGTLRAETLRLVDAELSVRITPEGEVIVSTAGTSQPLATGKVPTRPLVIAPAETPQTPSSPDQPSAAATASAPGLLAVMNWLDTLGSRGLDGQSLNEIGLRNGSLMVDDQQSRTQISFDNINLSLRRPAAGGVVMTVGEEGSKETAWSLRVGVGAPANGVRPIELVANNVPTKNLILAARIKDFTFTADGLPISGEIKGEVGRDGLPTYLSGALSIGKGSIIDRSTPDYPMAIDRIEARLDWDAGRRVMVAPFQIASGSNRITSLAHLEAPNGQTPNWQLGLSGGTILLAGPNGENPVIFNHIAVRLQFDTEHRRVVMTQSDISNGEIGVAGSGAFDYSTPATQVQLGLATTSMPASALKNIWPILIAPEVREWLIERVNSGTLQHLDIAVNAPVRTLARGGPPIPDEGLSVDFSATGVELYPLDEMPVVHNADMKGHVSGRTAKVTIGQGGVDTPGGRKLTISDVLFQVPDLVPKPAPASVRFRIDGPVPAAAEILQSNRLKDVGGSVIDPATSKGNVAAVVTLNMPLKTALTKEDTKYSVNVDLGGVAIDKLAMNQKLEANALKVVADNEGYRVKGDVKIAGQPASLDYRKDADGGADIRLAATLDDNARAKLGVDLGASVSGAIPVKISGKIGTDDSKLGVEADLTPAKIDNILPGWTKIAGKAGRISFNVVQKPQGTRFEDVVIEGNGTLIKGTVEVDQSNELVSAVFPTFAPSEGDKASLKAERASDGSLKVTLRGDVFDGRGFIKSALSGSSKSGGGKAAAVKLDNVDIDARLGAIAGFYGEAIRGFDLKISRRGGTIRAFSLSGKIGRDTPVTGSLRSRGRGRDLLFVETRDAGALFRFTDTYSKMIGGEMWVAMDTPTADDAPQEGLLNVTDFTVKGEAALDRVVNNGGNVNSKGVPFSRMRTEFTRQTGQLRIKDGVVRGPAVGATIEGDIDYAANQVRMSGTFVPMYGLNNMFGQIPIVGLVLGGGSNEGLIGLTYEVVGTPGAPVLRVNPISAMAPGVLRKIFDFNTGKQQNLPPDFQSMQ